MTDNELQKQITERDFELVKLKREISRLQSKIERDKERSASLSAVSVLQSADETGSAEKSRLEQYMTLLLDNSPDIIILLDRAGRFAYCTRVFLDLAGIRDINTVTGRSFREIFETYIGTEDARAIVKAFESSRAEGSSKQLEASIIVGDETCVFNIRMAPLFMSTGEIVRSVVTMHDITEIYRAREHTEQAKELAEDASRAKSAFLSNMSHEMRTPMNAIIGMTAIGRGAANNNRKDYCFGKIDEASTHLLSVINDVLDISKIEAHKFELSISEFEFERALRKAVNVVRFPSEAKSQTLEVSIDERIPSALRGDDQRLTQVITNLLSNAVKFTPEGGEIKVTCDIVSRVGDECLVQVSVSDTGIGISSEQQRHLFTSFEQADSGISRKFGGAGLGLSISKNIVELMGGKISVISKLGEGSTFTFAVRLGIADGSEGGKSMLGGISYHTLHVLIVDEAEEILDYFLELSARFGFQCEAALSATAALTLTDIRGGYDMYFISQSLPDMDGSELHQRIVLREFKESVFVMMANSSRDVPPPTLYSGIQRYITKPLSPSAIVNVINESFGLRVYEATAANDENIDDIFKGKRVLFAEDVEINREILLALLEATGVELVLAENGIQALALYSKKPDDFDMILMDMQMPEMDGVEATRRIRALNDERAQAIPIVAMTANVFREDIEACLAAGMNDHLGKPINMTDVLTKMKKYMM